MKTTALCAPPDAILAQLQTILDSRGFHSSERMRRFLEFVVKQAISDEDVAIKETTVGVEVFDRTPGYDPKSDPIVRVEARRLRTKLDQYYESEGADDELVITLPKGGYLPRFESRKPLVDSEAQPEIVELAAPIEAEAPAPRSRSLPLWIALSAALAVLGVAGAIYATRRLPASQPVELPPVTTLEGQQFDASLAPDGKEIAFVWNRDGNRDDIYVKLMDLGDAIRVTQGGTHNVHPSWSPDGRRLAFLRVFPNRQQAIVVPALGGPERVVQETNGDITGWGNPGPVWSPDGAYLAISEALDRGGRSGVFLEPVWDGNRRQLTNPGPAMHDFYPAFSPDGRKLAFARYTSNSAADVFVAAADGSGARQVTSDRRDIRGITWLADNRTIVFSSNRSGPYGLWLTDGNESPRPLPTHSNKAVEPFAARGGNWLVYTNASENENVWRWTMPGKLGGVKAVGEKWIASSRRTHSPQYSPDGSRIAFVSDRSGAWEIWTCRADGSEPVQLTSFQGPMVGTPRWSPDGRSIAFDARPDGNSAVFIVPAGGGTARRVEVNRYEERMPNWSRDGKWLYFSSNRDGDVRLWKRPVADGGVPVRITRRPAFDSAESADAKSVFFIGPGPGIWRVPSSGGEETQVPELSKVNPKRYWTMANGGIYFAEREDQAWSIHFFDPATRQSRVAMPLDVDLVTNTPSLTVSPDGRSVLIAQRDRSASDIARLSDVR